MEFTLLFSALIAALAMYLMLWWEAKRGNAADCTKDLWEIGLMAAIVGVFIGRIATMVSDGVNPILHPGDIIIVRAGVATGWAALGAILVVIWQGRGQFWIVADGLSAAALAGLAGWHGGCTIRDACLGTPTDLPWGLTQPGSPISRHPVEIYAAIAFAIAAFALASWKARGRPPLGVPAGLALVIAGAIRLLTEPFRPGLAGGPIAWYLVALAAGSAIVACSSRTSKPTALPAPSTLR